MPDKTSWSRIPVRPTARISTACASPTEKRGQSSMAMSRFGFAKSIHDIAGAVFLTNSNTASRPHTLETACLAHPDLFDRYRSRGTVVAGLADSQLVSSQPFSAHCASDFGKGHSQAFGRYLDQPRFACVASHLRTRGHLCFQFSRLLGAICSGAKSEVSGSEL